jgi:hypothetical protein
MVLKKNLVICLFCNSNGYYQTLSEMKTLLFIFLAAVITLGAIVYQRATGPTYPKKAEVSINGTTYQLKLTRSHGGESDCRLSFDIPDNTIGGTVTYRKYPTKDPWITTNMSRESGQLVAYLPNQPPAGKLEYKVEFSNGEKLYPLHESNAIVVRFKGDVPAIILAPHVILMFLAMFLSNLTGVSAFFRHGNYRALALWTLILLGLGGMVMGPWVQWHAFGEAWAGVPFAWDLTDNKTLLAFIFWILAVVMNRKKAHPRYIILAALVMLIIYLIPHSMYGSQLDPETSRIIQG